MQLTERSLYFYNKGGKLLKEEIYSFSSVWDLMSKREYEYNSEENITCIKFYHFKDEEWVEFEKTDYIYLDGNLIEKTSSSLSDNEYSEYYSQTYDYNENNRVKFYKSFNIVDDEFLMENYYDYNENILDEIYYQYNEETDIFEKSFKTHYVFNYNIGKDEISIPLEINNEGINREFNNLLLSYDYYSWDNENEEWNIIDMFTKFFFSTKQIQLGVDIKPISKSLINVYPNPAVDKININLDKVYNSAKIEILDITGKSILNQNLNIKKM